MARIDWDRVNEGLERERHRMIWRPYGLPTVVDLERSAFVDAAPAPPWPIPEKLIVSVAITGAFFTPDNNPDQPITIDDILDQSIECARAGASTIHLHVRDDRGYNTLSAERFRAVIEPLREAVPGIAVDGCLVAALAGEWEQMLEVLDAGLLDGVPINTTATYVGDALFAKPVPVILEKTRLVQEAGAKPIIAVYTDADVGNAERYLLRSGLVESPSYWIVLPALPGCSPMETPRQMFDGLLRISAAIYDCDPEATILVCAAGRASTYLVTIAAALGLHVRVGMEDTVWKWPHRPDRIERNVDMLEMAKGLAAILGREVADPLEYRRLVGLPEHAGADAR
jgi:3-keto-5-aminohexanoate cleavage enzyme